MWDKYIVEEGGDERGGSYREVKDRPVAGRSVLIIALALCHPTMMSPMIILVFKGHFLMVDPADTAPMAEQLHNKIHQNLATKTTT
mmetsp:Transcript_87715/g.253333  ORF Transcript_87715/g.253333 Transcript_87715/m.253333 type:complete len:86 (-) Transcript_87715:270-527(-)